MLMKEAQAVGGIVVQRTSHQARLTAGSWRARVRVLIDALIDRAHHEHPTAFAVLTLPSGERMYVASHVAAQPACPTGHSGFFGERIRPFHGPAAIPGRGSSDLRPLLLDVHCDPAVRHRLRYRLDLRSGDLETTLGDGSGARPRADRRESPRR